MGRVFDCRFNNIIINGMKSDDHYLMIGESDIMPERDDIIIGTTGDIFVFDNVWPQEGTKKFDARLLDPELKIKSNKTPSYRFCKRALISQLKRDDKRR